MAKRQKIEKPDLTPAVLAFATQVEPDRVHACTSIHDAGAYLSFVVGPIPERQDNDAARALDKEMAENEQRREDSFQRSDTDGFLTQWACQITANRARKAAEVARRGGLDCHPGLFRASDGKRIRAKLIDGKFGACWAVCDREGKFTGKFISDNRGPRAALAKLGLVVCGEYVPSRANIRGTGTGLSGNAWACVERTDGGYPPNAEDL